MNFFMSSAFSWLWLILYLVFTALAALTLIKFVIVLFKADRAIDEVREYIRRRS